MPVLQPQCLRRLPRSIVDATEVSIVPVLPDVPLNADLLSKLMLAEMSYFRNDPHTAIEIFEEVGFETRDPRIVARVSKLAIENSRLDVAANTTDLWVELSPENFEAWYWRGAVKVITGDHRDAPLDFYKALELGTDQAILTQEIARIINSNLDPEAAYDLFDVVMSRFPDNQIGRLIQINLAMRRDFRRQKQ